MASGLIPKYADGTDTGWLEVPSLTSSDDGFTGTMYYRKVGNVVTVMAYRMHLKADLSISYRNLCAANSVPRPKVITGAVTRELGYMLLHDTGYLRYYRPNGVIVTTTDDITFCITYITA